MDKVEKISEKYKLPRRKGCQVGGETIQDQDCIHEVEFSAYHLPK
jgi:hypothetical protein